MSSRRGHKEGSIFQRARDKKWCAQVDLGWVDGKRKRKIYTGDTRNEVVKKLREAQLALEKGLPISFERQTVAQFLEFWLENFKVGNVRPRTLETYRQMCDRHIVPALGHHLVSKLQAEHVQHFLRHARNLRTDKPLSARSVGMLREILRNALNHAVKLGRATANVAALTPVPKGERHEITPYTPEQAIKLLTVCKEERVGALFSVAMAVGLRLGEASGLRWSDIDLAKGVVTVSQQLQRVGKKLVVSSPKTRSARRVVMLPKFAVVALREHRIRQFEERAHAGELWKADIDTFGELVFTTEVGTPIDPSNASRIYRSIVAKAGIPKRRIHDLRHTCATLLVTQGVHLKVIQEILGHSTFRLTADTYSHVNEAVQSEAMGKMDALFAPKEQKTG